MDSKWDPGESPFSNITNQNKRAFLEAFAETGRKGEACRIAGIDKSTPHGRGWKEDPEFQEGLELARLMAVDLMADAAHTRGVDGVRSYKFDKDGGFLRHPELCECGHMLAAHPRPAATDGSTDGTTDGPLACLDCECPGFVGAPYYEHAYSDRILEVLLRAHDPERFRQVKEVRGFMANLDMNRLPNWAIERIAKGEQPLVVLASGFDQGLIGAGSPPVEPEAVVVEAEVLEEPEPPAGSGEVGPDDADDL